MIRFKDPNGQYSPDYVDGWFTKFFPFDSCEKIIDGPIYEIIEMPSKMLSFPVILKVIPPGKNPDEVEDIKCELLAGFVGMTQNKNNSSFKPEIQM